MNAAEFDAYYERAIPDYARDKIASGQWAEDESLSLARSGIEALLPQGLQSKDNFLFSLRERDSGATVGMLWYAIQARAGQSVAYVYDVLVEPHYQRLGYATAAFAALEVEVASRGCAGIALHVFGHNQAARALYAKLGYEATNINLFKTIPT